MVYAPSPRRRARGARRLLGLALSLGCVAPVAAIEDLVKTECAQCHGATGTSVAPTFPNIGGLHAEYIAKQLREFARAAQPDAGTIKLRPGAVANADVARPSDVMSPIAAKLTGAQIKALADWFSSQPRPGGTSFNPGMAELGRTVYLTGNRESGLPACAGCHRQDGGGTDRTPMLAGQNSAYVLAQLRAFRSDQRANDRGMLMRTTAGRMTEQEMIAVSEYVAGLAGGAGAR